MTREGGVKCLDQVFVTELPAETVAIQLAAYGINEIAQVAVNSPSHGVSFLIVPAFSEVHRFYAENAPDFPEMFLKPIMGWVSGVQVEDMGKVHPKVYMGSSGQKFEDQAVAMHVTLDAKVSAKIDIVNLFEPGSGPTITFPDTSFTVKECWIDGQSVTLAKYISDNNLDSRLPLVTDLCGAIINSSIASIDFLKDEVTFYAPVFPGHDYHFAKKVDDYAKTFARIVPKNVEMAFSCNCILNYLYGELEGKKLAGTAGPITFGEIAYQLLNQTMVFLELERA
jgi:hypothetical protein